MYDAADFIWFECFINNYQEYYAKTEYLLRQISKISYVSGALNCQL